MKKNEENGETQVANGYKVTGRISKSRNLIHMSTTVNTTVLHIWIFVK